VKPDCVPPLFVRVGLLIAEFIRPYRGEMPMVVAINDPGRGFPAGYRLPPDAGRALFLRAAKCLASERESNATCLKFHHGFLLRGLCSFRQITMGGRAPTSLRVAEISLKSAFSAAM
jgi:hypothetical protein